MHKILFRLFLPFILGVVIFLKQGSAQSLPAPASIHLNARVTSAAKTIRIGDVARVNCSDSNRKQNIEKLDLEALDPNRTETVEISRQQIKIRLMLAGLEENTLILGANQSRIHPASESHTRLPAKLASRVSPHSPTRETDSISHRLLTLIQAKLAQRFRVQPTDVLVEFVNLNRVRFPDVEPGKITLLTEVDRMLGQRTLKFAIASNTGTVQHKDLLTKISIYKEILVPTRAIRRGEAIDESNTRPQKKPFYNNSISRYAGREHLGQFAAQNLRADNLIPVTMVASRSQRNRNIPVVRRRDQVRAVVIKGKMRIDMEGAIVQKDGKIGEVIQVKNPTSGKVFSARVVSPNEVRVIY